ncbi:MAG: hypothetical protein U0U69_16515 [Acidimicrobiia bacterium]
MAADADTFSGVPGAAAPADWRELRLADFATLARVFDAGEAPSAGELDGAYRGRVIAVAGTDAAPTPLRRLLDLFYGAPPPLMPWAGKRFDTTRDGRTGTNIWLTGAGPCFADFQVSSAESTSVLDYDVDQNPRPLRAVRGEVVRLAAGLYLGRMSLRLGARSPTLVYFVLLAE